MLSKIKLPDIFKPKQDRPTTSSLSSIPFDQNYFQLHTQFNGTNLSLISIFATILKGEKSKQKLNLKCKWYIKTIDDFRQMPEITGNFYQPCLDDIGSIISVQIQPFMEDREYQGITIVKEFGPIKLDAKLEQFQSMISKTKMFNSNVKLESVASDDERFADLELPLEGTMILDEQWLQFLAMGRSMFKYQLKDYKITTESIRKAPNSLYLRINDESFRLTAESTLKRDQLIFAIKRFTTSVVVSEVDVSHQLRIDQLVKINNTTRKQLENMKIEHEYAVKSKSVLEEESKILKERLKEYDSIVESNNQLKADNAKITNENSYYINEISIYKKLDKEKQAVIEKLEGDILKINSLLENQKQQTGKVEQKFSYQLSLLRQQYQSLQKQLSNQKHKKSQLQQQIQQKAEAHIRLELKYNTLISDRSIIDTTKSKKESQQKQLQIQALKSQIFNLQSLLSKHRSEENQTRRIWDIKQLLSGLKNTKNNNEATTYLQKLVANLTETVTQKQLELATQKESNKVINQELMKYRNKYGELKEEKEKEKEG